MSTLPVNSCALCYCATLTLAIGIAVPALAQQGGAYRAVSHVTVQPGRDGEWRAAIKERNELLKKAGVTRRTTVWQSASGPVEYRLVTYHEKLAELDTPLRLDPKMKDYQAELASINARLTSCSTITSRVIDQVQPDVSLPLGPEPPKMIVVARAVIRADKVNDYMALTKSDYFPAVKAAGVKSWSVTRTRFGGPGSEVYSSEGIDSWADVDGMGRIQKAMGPDKYEAFVAKATTMTVTRTRNIYRYMPDLSYRPAAANSTGN